MSSQVIFSEHFKKFLKAYLDPNIGTHQNLSGGNDRSLGSALLYEKIRVAVEYQEEHLVFKNAVARIFKRKYALNPTILADDLSADLLQELSWANYLNPEAVDPREHSRLKIVLKKYLLLLGFLQSKKIHHFNSKKVIIDLAACEISEIFSPFEKNELLINFCYDILKNNLRLEGSHVETEKNEIQLKLAIYTLLFKPDAALVQHFLLKNEYKDLQAFSEEEIKEFARRYEKLFIKISFLTGHPYRQRYLNYTRRNLPPFILLKNLYLDKSVSYEKIEANPNLIGKIAAARYDNLVHNAGSKIWRGTIRALIFILITKISLALILEVPYDRYFRGRIDVLPLVINVLLPPILMLLAGVFIKSPSGKNRAAVSSAFGNVITQDKVNDRVFYLAEQPQHHIAPFFNFIYKIFTLAILVAVTWVLVRLDFNVLSIILFFLFVSAVSFFSFRIRNIATELTMAPGRDDLITSAIEFIFLPFIRIGKIISELFARSNPFILTLDFLIEAPLKTILTILSRWLKFVRSKKEEIEY